MIFFKGREIFWRQAGRQSLCTLLHRQQARGGPCPSFFFNELSFCSYCFSPRKENKKAKKPRKVQIEKAFSPFGHGLESCSATTNLRRTQRRGCWGSEGSARKFSVQETVPLLILLLFFFFQRSFGTLGKEVCWPHFVAISIIRLVLVFSSKKPIFQKSLCMMS